MSYGAKWLFNDDHRIGRRRVQRTDRILRGMTVAAHGFALPLFMIQAIKAHFTLPVQPGQGGYAHVTGRSFSRGMLFDVTTNQEEVRNCE
jgi:hypothetical protein